MSLLARALVLLPAVAPVQDPAPGDSPAAVLDALIERTGALRAFLARYELRKGEDEALRFTLAYQAPERLFLELRRGGEGSGSRARMWAVGTRLSTRMERAGGESAAADVDFARLPGPVAAARTALDARFPSPAWTLGPGGAVDMRWGVNETTDKAEFDVQLSYQPGGRPALVGWLTRLRQEVGSCTLDDGALSWSREDGRLRARVSRRTGFLESLELVGKDGERLELRLEQLELDGAGEPGTFDVPPRVQGDEDLLPDGGAALLGGPAELRRALQARVAAGLRAGRRPWDPDLREDAAAVLDVLHGGLLAPRLEELRPAVERRAQELGAWLRAELAKAPPGDPAKRQELRKTVRDLRDQLVRQLDADLVRYLGNLPSLDLPAGEAPRLEPLLALEREVVGAAFTREVRGPLLELLDAPVREALGD